MDRTLNNLSGSGVKNLRKTLAALNREINSGKIEQGFSLWEKYQKSISEVRGDLKKISDEQKAAAESVEKTGNAFAEWGKKWVGAVSIVSTAFYRISGIKSAAMEYVQAYADMLEAESQVIKYMGRTKDEVEDLNESLKKMDTRTSREALNALAGDAGKLGITGKKEILEFVEPKSVIRDFHKQNVR